MSRPPATISARTVHSHHARCLLPITPCQMHPAAMINDARGTMGNKRADQPHAEQQQGDAPDEGF